VNFLFNSDFEHVRQHGLKVDSVMGDFHLKNVRAFGKAEQMPACDVVLVCLKTTNNNLLKQIFLRLFIRKA
jgi:2-dehydropantoate 2-reductase